MHELEANLRRLCQGGQPHAWYRHPDVSLDSDWAEFKAAFSSSDADLIATSIRTREEDPGWDWWTSLAPPQSFSGHFGEVAGLLPLIRVTRRAAEAILLGLQQGWRGHPEALVPTLVHAAGLTIEDIGGTGSFTPSARKSRWYTSRTWRWSGPVEYVPGMLHFPIPAPDRPLAPHRMERDERPERLPRILFASPVGLYARDLLPATLGIFAGCGADCVLIQYDNTELNLPDGFRPIADQGHKWQLAIRHLRPEFVDHYHYLFFWDDDLDCTAIDPLRFVEIMRQNRLDMAQPAIESSHDLAHPITGRHPCPSPRRGPTGTPEYLGVGRLTNFVEIMAPVFTSQAWREFYGYLDPANQCGWGYDYIPLGRKGIVDALTVVHTRAVQSISNGSEEEAARFIDDQGLFRHGVANQGILFEKIVPPPRQNGDVQRDSSGKMYGFILE